METRTYTKEELDAMPEGALLELLLKATEITGTVLVRDKDGNPKYDDPSLAGTYGEANGT